MGVGLVLLGLALVAGFASYTVSLLTLLEEQNAVIRRLSEDLERNGEMLHTMTAGNSQLVHLAGPSGSDGWRGALLWDPGTRRAFLQLTGIAGADAGEKYHLWIVGKGQPVSIAGFTVPATGAVSLYVGRLPDHDGNETVVVVTTDPEGSADFSSGTLVLAGTLHEP
jgi:hypothetical protein